MSTPCKNIPTTQSRSEVWINWHKSLRKWFDRQESNEHWLRFWQQRAGAGSTADTSDLREYMREQGVEITTDWSGEISDAVDGAMGWFSDSFTMLRNIFYGAIVLIIGIVAYFLITRINQGKTAREIKLELGEAMNKSTLQPLAIGNNQKLLT